MTVTLVVPASTGWRMRVPVTTTSATSSSAACAIDKHRNSVSAAAPHRMTGSVAKLETFGEVVLTGSIDELVQLTSSMTNAKFCFVMVILQPVAVRLRKRPIAVIYTGP